MSRLLLFNQNSIERRIANWRSPVLLLYGDDDRNVPFQQTTDLVEKLRAQNIVFEELIIPDEIHDLLRWSDWVRAHTAPPPNSSTANYLSPANGSNPAARKQASGLNVDRNALLGLSQVLIRQPVGQARVQ